MTKKNVGSIPREMTTANSPRTLVSAYHQRTGVSTHRLTTYHGPEMEPGLRVTGQRVTGWVSNLGPGRVGSRVKALIRLFDPDS